MGADLLGVELIRGGAAPTEGHQIGLQIDNLLAETKATEGKLRQAARTRKSKLRGKEQASELLDAKLLAIDKKLAADRAALWGSSIELELPKAPIKVKHEVKCEQPKAKLEPAHLRYNPVQERRRQCAE